MNWILLMSGAVPLLIILLCATLMYSTILGYDEIEEDVMKKISTLYWIIYVSVLFSVGVVLGIAS